MLSSPVFHLLFPQRWLENLAKTTSSFIVIPSVLVSYLEREREGKNQDKIEMTREIGLSASWDGGQPLPNNHHLLLWIGTRQASPGRSLRKRPEGILAWRQPAIGTFSFPACSIALIQPPLARGHCMENKAGLRYE